MGWDTSHLFDTSGLALSGTLDIIAEAPKPGRTTFLLAGLLWVSSRRLRPSRES